MKGGHGALHSHSKKQAVVELAWQAGRLSKQWDAWGGAGGACFWRALKWNTKDQVIILGYKPRPATFLVHIDE